MVETYPWLGNLHQVGIGPEYVGVICVGASAVCGAIVGIERERRDKPAGLRTNILISIGSTILTMTSILIAGTKPTADPARLAAQILPGIGFIGAGAILHARGTVVGLTTGATLWAVAAVGVTIGAGYVAAGACFTVLIFFTLDILHRSEWILLGRCCLRRARLAYRPEGGKTFPKIQEILDHYRVPDRKTVRGSRGGDEKFVEVPVCTRHRHHRLILKEIAELPEVTAIEVEEDGAEAPRAAHAPLGDSFRP